MSAPAALQQFVHRFVPAETGVDRPALLMLHGTGGNEDDLLPLGRMLAPGAALLSPRGRVLENGAPRFFRRLAEGVFDLEDLRVRTVELADFIAAAGQAYGLGRGLIAVGFSNGANIAASILLEGRDLFRAAILIRPMVPFAPDSAARLPGTPVWIGAGRNDPTVRPGESERLAELLRAVGAAVTIHWEAAGHSIGAGEVRAAREWLAVL
jgi:phospholipase/carboxylesterase/glyoxalase family protein